MNIVFMGTPDFAKKLLKKLIESKLFNLKVVITNPDRPKGRGRIMTASPVKEIALENNLRVIQPEKIKGNIKLFDELKNMNLDLIVVVAYGKILPKELLDIPKNGCVNVHRIFTS